MCINLRTIREPSLDALTRYGRTIQTAAMCGRFASRLPSLAIAALFRTQGDLPNLGPNWNTAPTQAAFVVHRNPPIQSEPKTL
jgi:hypothetical protein